MSSRLKHKQYVETDHTIPVVENNDRHTNFELFTLWSDALRWRPWIHMEGSNLQIFIFLKSTRIQLLRSNRKHRRCNGHVFSIHPPIYSENESNIVENHRYWHIVASDKHRWKFSKYVCNAVDRSTQCMSERVWKIFDYWFCFLWTPQHATFQYWTIAAR